MLGAQGLLAGTDLYRAIPIGLQFIRSHPKDRHQRPTEGFEPLTQGSSYHCTRRSNHCATQVAPLTMEWLTSLTWSSLTNTYTRDVI
jgi:hypothetical protein